MIKEVNGEARDKASRSRSGDITFGVLKHLRNSIKTELITSASSYCDILGGQETGSFSFTLLVSSVIPMQEIAASTFKLLLRLMLFRSFDAVHEIEIQYYLHTNRLAMFSENLILLHRH